MPVLAPPQGTGHPGPAIPPGDTPRTSFGLILGPASGGYVSPVQWSTSTPPSFTWRLTDAHDGQFTVNAGEGNDAGIIPLATDLHVLWAGTPVLRARIGPASDTLDGSSHYATFTVNSYRAILDRRQFWSTSALSFTGDIGDVVWGLLSQAQNRPGGALGIGKGQGFPFGQQVSKTVSPGDLVAQSIDDLAYVDGPGGFDWDITPRDQSAQAIDLWPVARGADRGVYLQYGDQLTDVPWQRSTDTSTFADAIRMTGGTPTSGSGPLPVEMFAPDLATRPEGAWDASFQSDETDPTLLAARALLQLQTSGTVIPSWTIPLRPGAWKGPSHIWIGDTVHVLPASGRLTAVEDLRVLELAANLTGDGDQVTLTIGAPAPDIGRALRQMIRELRTARKHRASGRVVKPV